MDLGAVLKAFGESQIQCKFRINDYTFWLCFFSLSLTHWYNYFQPKTCYLFPNLYFHITHPSNVSLKSIALTLINIYADKQKYFSQLTDNLTDIFTNLILIWNIKKKIVSSSNICMHVVYFFKFVFHK